VQGTAQPIIAAVGLAFEARIAASPHTRVICSGDGRNLAAMLERALAAGCAGVVSFGLAGGLAMELRPGACVVASEILSDADRIPTHPDWSRNLLRAIPEAIHGSVLGVAAPIVDPATKQALRRQSGAHAVDTESHLVARAAAARNLPLAAIRVVADPADRGVPPAALAGVRPDGRTDVFAVVRALLRQPREFPALVRVALDARAARASLLRGRQLAGPRFAFPDFGQLEVDVT
jgi:adenosylhomocysteine nucleosidase